MKRIFSLTLALCLLLCGCGNLKSEQALHDNQMVAPATSDEQTTSPYIPLPTPSVTESSPLQESESGLITLYILISETEYVDGKPCYHKDYAYDEAAQLVKVTENGYYIIPSNVNSQIDNVDSYIQQYGKVDEITEYSYDHAGNLDCRANCYDYNTALANEYNEEGQLVRYEDGYTKYRGKMLPIFYELAYDENGNVAVVYIKKGTILVNRWEFLYDEKGRLTQETRISNTGATRSEFIYTDDLLTCRNFYYGEYASEAESTNLNLEFSYRIDYRYDRQGYLMERTRTESDGSVSGQVKYNYDAIGYLVAQSSDKMAEVYSYDKHGNMIKLQFAENSWFEYEYEAITVTRQQAENYRNRYYIQKYHNPIDSLAYSDVRFYYLIPNPVWNLPMWFT